jgi:hypothetical protein
VELKSLAEYLNNLSGGENVYGYDEAANKIIVIDRTSGTTVIISLENAHNSLKKMALGMQSILSDIFNEMIEEKAASNGGDSK